MEKAAHDERLFFGNETKENKVKQGKSNGFLFALDDRFEMQAIGLKVRLFFSKNGSFKSDYCIKDVF